MADLKRWPVVFTGHGYPMNAITDNPARPGWRDIGQRIGKPEVIIAMTSHWESDGTLVHLAPENPQLFDIEDLPEEIYSVDYKPVNSPGYVERILELLAPDVYPDNTWGIDHALWTTLSNMYPDADVPVVVISTNMEASCEEIMEIGRKLRPLRDEGALIFGTGNVVHNVDMVDHNMPKGFDWAEEFDRNVREIILAGEYEKLTNYKALKNHELALPTLDHYYPLLFVLGAADKNDKVTVFNEYTELASLSMTSYLLEGFTDGEKNT